MADKNYTVIGISLPDDMWSSIKEYSDEWEANRSATVRRIILEWSKAQKAHSATPKKQKSEAVIIAA